MKITRGVSCEVCNQQRAPGTIHKQESRVIKGVNLLVCDKCREEQKEPRAFIILMIKKKGLPAMAEYIKHQRYPGPKIDLEDLI